MKLIKELIIFILVISVLVQAAAASDIPEVKAVFQLTNDTAHEYDAAWSPDDSRIVYAMERLHAGSEIWIMDSDGSNKKSYLQSADWLGETNWGEGGILYTSLYSFKRDRHLDIWILDPATGTSRQLTGNKTDQKKPVWNNNSSSILFLGRTNYYYEIWTMDPDATNITRITLLQTTIEDIAWSPDNSRIAYADGDSIWVMNSDGTNIQQLTNDNFTQSDPAWSPDGNWIAYTSDRNGDDDIWVMRADGSDQSVLINESKKQTDPEWSHDGTMLLYTSNQDGNGDIWAAAIHIKPSTPTPTPFQTQIIVTEETRENVSRLTILGGVFVVIVVLIIILRIVKSMKR